MTKFSLLFAAAITFISCDSTDSIHESGDKTLLLEKKKIECSYEKSFTRVFVKTNIDFELDTEDYCSWIDYKAGEDSVFIDIDKNWSTDTRSCNLILANDRYNLADTLVILQEAYIFSGSGGNSSGGNGGNGSGNNNGSNNGGSGGGGSNNGGSGGDINNGGSPVSRQCAAYTKKGKRCKRTASKGSIYCWQH